MTKPQWFLAFIASAVGLLVCAAALSAPRGLDKPRAPQTARTQAAVQRGIDSASPHAYRLDPGPYEVRQHDMLLHDSPRGKDLEIRIYVPTPKPNVRLSEASLPLVVFSHGAGGSRDVGTELLAHWASHGYVVVAPTHADSIRLQRAAGVKPDINKTIASLGRPVNRAERVADCTCILDNIGQIEAAVPELQGRVDLERVGIAGHSAGAMTTMLATGVKGRLHGAIADSRFDCALVLSGQGVGRGGLFTADSWQDWAVPALVATGSLDTSTRTGQTAESRREPYERTPATGDKYLLWIEGATHQSFTGKLRGGDLPEAAQQAILEYLEPDSGITEQAKGYDQTAIFQAVQSVTLAFLDAYLKDNAEAQGYLASGDAEELLSGVALEHK